VRQKKAHARIFLVSEGRAFSPAATRHYNGKTQSLSSRAKRGICFFSQMPKKEQILRAKASLIPASPRFVEIFSGI
jgi:hypothetical protein